MITSNPQGSCPQVLVGRSDAPTIFLLDLNLAANVPFLLFQTHVVSNGQNTIRPQKVILQGEGTITEGAAVLILDQTRYEPQQVLMFPSNALNDNLLEVNFAGDAICRQWSVVFALSGFNIVIRNQIAVNNQVGT